MNPTTAESDRTSDNTLLGTSAGSCAAVGFVVSPLAGLVVGLAVAAMQLAARRRMPTAREIAKVLGALAVACAIVLLITDWESFKEGILQGFHRTGRP